MVSPEPQVLIDGVPRRVTGAQMAVVEDGRVLLQLRPWPPGWELPGGHCAHGEEPAATAVRECREETGLEVRVDRLVGVYDWAGWRSAGDALYAGTVLGGTPRRSIESLGLRYVDPHTLPRGVFPWIPQRLADALAAVAGAPPVHRVQPVHLRHVLFFGMDWAGVGVDWVRATLRRRRR